MKTLLKYSTDLARGLRNGTSSVQTFGAGFHSYLIADTGLDAFVVEYDDAWKPMKKASLTHGIRKVMFDAFGGAPDTDSKSYKAWNKADAANKVCTKLKVYKSSVTGLLALVREVDRKLAWDDVTADDWAEVVAMATLAKSMENIKNFVAYGGTPDAPNKAPTANRMPVAIDEVDDLEAALSLMISEQIDETCATAAMLAIVPILVAGRERVARKA